MGLDQFAYARPPRKRKNDADVCISEWRKHNRLQGWMQQLWEDKGCPDANTVDDPDGTFNCVELILERSDIDNLEHAINNFELPEASGFFWGSDSYFWTDDNGESFPDNEYWYKQHDLNFVKQARDMIDNKWRVFYSAWY